MKRFLVLCFFVILLLCCGASAAQTAAQTDGDGSDLSNTLPPVSERQPLADDVLEPVQEKVSSEADREKISQNFPLVERVSSLAKKTNWAILISFLATIFAGLAWLAGMRGVKVSKDALAETVAANKRSQRAYVGIRTYNYHFLPMSDGRVSFCATCIVKNFGQTPALNHKNSVQLEIVDDSFEGDIETSAHQSAGITLFPNTEPQLSVDLIISAQEADAIRTQSKRVIVRVHIAYGDILGETHWSKTQYFLKVTGAGSKFLEEHGGTLTYSSEENSYQDII